MRLLIDAYWWLDGPPSNRMVVRELVRTWATDHPHDQLFVAAPRGSEARVAEECPPTVAIVPVRGRQHALANLAGLPLLARTLGVDAVFSQAFTPLVGTAVTFMHDALFQSNPEWFTRAERLYLGNIPRAARRARIVFTSSVKEAGLIQAHNPHLRDVRPVGLSVATSLLGAEPVAPPGVEELDGFLLSVGRLNVRKNLRFTIEAALRSGAISPTRPLLIVGAPDGQQDVLPPTARRAIEDRSVRYLGHVRDDELAWLYGHADLFVYLSLDEGFGLPPMEALSFGCPVLVSDAAVFREVAGDHGTYVDPHDLDAAAAAIASAPRPRVDVTGFEPPSWSDIVGRIREGVLEVTGG